jgi:hypothetical protein
MPQQPTLADDTNCDYVGWFPRDVPRAAPTRVLSHLEAVLTNGEKRPEHALQIGDPPQ